MNINETYITAQIFGQETARQPVASADTFRDIVKAALSPLTTLPFALQCRGTILGKGVTPRMGAFSESRLDTWSRALSNGYFLSFEVYDKEWTSDFVPRVYVHVSKIWGYENGAYQHENKQGPENGVTIAVQEGIYDGVQDKIILAFLQLFEMLDGTYAFVEKSVPWGNWDGFGYSRCINDRYLDASGNDYFRDGVSYPMSERLPQLYWANIVGEQHFAPGFQIADITQEEAKGVAVQVAPLQGWISDWREAAPPP